MKNTLKVFAVLSLMLFGFSGEMKAQDSESYLYRRLVGTPRLLSDKIDVSVDYGQETGFFEDTRIKDEDGKTKKFNTMIDALNYMGKDGWRLSETYITVVNNVAIYHWILEKKAPGNASYL